jgi:hypothetical protein
VVVAGAVVVVVGDVVVVAGAVVVVVGDVVVVVARCVVVDGSVVFVVTRAGEVVVVVDPARDEPLPVAPLDARVVVVAPRELSDNVAGLEWKLISPANPATVATATNPARLTAVVLSL